MDERLKKFIVLVEAGTYTKAARELHVSQPALSITIQKLETELGTPLLIRTGKRLELTDAGKAVYQAGQKHQEVQHDLGEELRAISKRRPSITIGMIDSIADRLCTTAAFSQLEEQADVTLVVNNSRHLRNEVERRGIACALVIDDELEHQGVVATPFISERLTLVSHREVSDEFKEQARQGVVWNFISYDRASTTQRHIRSHLASQGIKLRARLYSTSPSVMLRMVLHKNGCAVLPYEMCRELLGSGELVALADFIPRPIGLITVGQALPDYAASFFEDSQRLLEAGC